MSHLEGFATTLASRILAPKVLDESLESGVFLHAGSPELASHFLLDVFAPCLRSQNKRGLIVHIPAAELLIAANPACFRPAEVQDLILLLSDAQLLAVGSAGERIMKSLKARRDESNLKANPAGRFILVAAGSPGAVITNMVANSQQAFYGVTSLPIPID